MQVAYTKDLHHDYAPAKMLREQLSYLSRDDVLGHMLIEGNPSQEVHTCNLADDLQTLLIRWETNFAPHVTAEENAGFYTRAKGVYDSFISSEHTDFTAAIRSEGDVEQTGKAWKAHVFAALAELETYFSGNLRWEAFPEYVGIWPGRLHARDVKSLFFDGIGKIRKTITEDMLSDPQAILHFHDEAA